MDPRSFFTRDEEERAWVLDQHERGMPRVVGAFLLTVALCAPFISAGALAAAAGVAVVYALCKTWSRRTGRVEPIALAWFVGQTTFAVLIASEHAVVAGGLALLVPSVMGAGATFPDRVVWVTTVYSVALMAFVGLVLAWDDVSAQPLLFAAPLAAACAGSMLNTAARRASLEHRLASVVDPLTRLQNRNALVSHAAELTHQSTVTGGSVGVAVLDLDHFKRVNDTHGHITGDAVLVEVADRIRRHLRTYDVAYRLGGEEFVVLLPGADTARTAEVAERLRRAVAEAPVAGIPLTVSVGVAAAAPFAYDRVFADADRALFAAKDAGRDRVLTA